MLPRAILNELQRKKGNDHIKISEPPSFYHSIDAMKTAIVGLGIWRFHYRYSLPGRA